MIDSHCHLDFDDFHGDRANVIAFCKQLGVTNIMIPGVKISQWSSILSLVNQYPSLFFSVGVHPWFLSSLPGTKTCFQTYKQLLLNEMQSFLSHSNCRAIGECGLDKIKAGSDSAWLKQCTVFEAHCSISQDTQLPLIIHSVKSHETVLSYLKRYHLTRGVIHAFHGSAEQALAFYRQGFLLGAGGGITYRRAKKTRAAFAALPLEAIVLETDAPSMPIDGRQGERNSPEYIPLIAKHLADIRGVSVEAVITQTRLNTRMLFTIE